MQSDLENGRVVIRVSGEIDLSNAERLETQIDEATAGVPSVVIDLTAVDFIDSRGLRLLKRIATAVAERSGTFAVVAPPDSIARSVLDLTRMTDELGVRDSLPTAVD
jgi:anti-sigma B factor antagonist